jgi:hypothetical protein
MNNESINTGFSYFTEPKYFINKQLKVWLPAIQKLGASLVIFESSFSNAIPEDAFIIAQENGMEPVIQFTTELPIARKFNEISILLDVYHKWGVKKIIFGDRPNTRQYWINAGWHYDNLVDHYLDRFIPLANYTVQKGMTPIMAPLQPGGDYWDTAFAELALSGLRQRRMDGIIERLILAAFGFTFNKPLTWGSGGPERWPSSKPYLTPDGQEDQLGFQNYEWLQAQAERTIGVKKPVILLNAGHPGTSFSEPDPEQTISFIQSIHSACTYSQHNENEISEISIDDSVDVITFSLNALQQIFEGKLSTKILDEIFSQQPKSGKNLGEIENKEKKISHYLLLPSHTSGVSDVVLNKVRPIIKKHQPTIGFSLTEAMLAHKVSVYPDPLLFGEKQINELRASGCVVEILPESGIDIATSLQ